jgi:hypothetical protein
MELYVWERLLQLFISTRYMEEKERLNHKKRLPMKWSLKESDEIKGDIEGGGVTTYEL